MKLRTVHFCVMCDEEVKPEEIHVKQECPNCGYKPRFKRETMIYEWKVEVKASEPNCGCEICRKFFLMKKLKEIPIKYLGGKENYIKWCSGEITYEELIKLDEKT